MRDQTIRINILRKDQDAKTSALYWANIYIPDTIQSANSMTNYSSWGIPSNEKTVSFFTAKGYSQEVTANEVKDYFKGGWVLNPPYSEMNISEEHRGLIANLLK